METRRPLSVSEAALGFVLERDRLVVAAALFALTAIAWLYILWLAADMDMGGMEMEDMRMIPAGAGLMAPAGTPWRGIEFAYVFAMWAVMMIGMMTPSVAPMLLIYARVGRQAAAQNKPFAGTAWFAGGYLLAWIAFAALATAAQWALDRTGLIGVKMESANLALGGALLVAAGVYQWTAAKDICLTQCQSPLVFIQRYGGFRSDIAGALHLGLCHGLYCVGCCWALMALLFVGGVMNVLWIAALSVLVLAEKVAPSRWRLPRIVGAGCVIAGLWLVIVGMT
jgi:predicted metal-binding membrane protein